MHRILFVLVALLGTFGVLAGDVSGQVVCRDCFEYYYFPGGGGVGIAQHAFVSPDDPCGSHHLAGGAQGEGGEEIYKCVRCGGTSECHELTQTGYCHIACGPSGGDELLMALALAVDASDGDWLRDLVRADSRVTVEDQGASLLVGLERGCGVPLSETSRIYLPPHLRFALAE
jgi:hypothetical protein